MSERPITRQSVTVEIGGERHTLRSDATAEYTQMVAAHLDSTIRAIGAGNTLEPHKTAILAGLTITDELFRARDEIARLRAEIAERAESLSVLLEDAHLKVPEQETRAPEA